MRNRWRLQKSTPEHQPTFNMKISHIVWEQKEEEVFAEMAKLMGLPFADSKTRNWFSYLSKALRNVTSRLTAEEEAEMRQELEQRKRDGNPDHVKRKCVVTFENVVQGCGAICSARFSYIVFTDNYLLTCTHTDWQKNSSTSALMMRQDETIWKWVFFP